MKMITIEEHVHLQRLGQAMANYDNEDSENAKAAGGKDLPYFPDFRVYSEDGISARIADMDRCGIDKQILSCPVQTQILDKREAADIVKEANDDLFAIIQKNKARFGGFGLLPWSDIDGSVQEIHRLKALGFDGVLLAGRPSMEAVFLDDEKFLPILRALVETNLPLYLHPAPPLKSVQEQYYGGLGEQLSARLSLYGWGWHNEVGVQCVRMILAGVFEKCPKLQVIVGHWGEFVPFFLSRLDQALPEKVTKNEKTITETFKKHFYVTPSGIFDYPQLQFCIDTLGADRIIHSVDFPFIPNDEAKSFLENAPIEQAAKEQIAYKNAERLFGR